MIAAVVAVVGGVMLGTLCAVVQLRQGLVLALAVFVAGITGLTFLVAGLVLAGTT